MKKVITYAIMLALLIIVLFAVRFRSNKPSDTVGVINNIEITKQELELSKKDYQVYSKPLANMNEQSIKENSQKTDLDFLKGIAKRKLIEHLFDQYKIELNSDEIKQAHDNFDEVMDVINELSNSENEEEKQDGLAMIECMKGAADCRGITMEQYIDEVLKKEYEYMMKADKLVKLKYNSAEEFQGYLQKAVDSSLRVKDKDLI